MKYGLIGYPLGHSFSQKYFTDKFSKENIKSSYNPYPIERIENVESLFSDSEISGFNVTIPYKQDIFKYLTEISEDASEIGAVNVVKIKRNDKGEAVGVKGFNSDWIGFSDSLKPLLNQKIRKALVLGTGGASKAVTYALRKLGIEPVLVSRNKSNDTLCYKDLDDRIMSENLLIVNTTPLGMWPNIDSSPSIPYDKLTSDHICYDVVYNPEMTEFMRCSAAKGATVKNGLEMLYGQAEEAWRIWNSDK